MIRTEEEVEAARLLIRRGTVAVSLLFAATSAAIAGTMAAHHESLGTVLKVVGLGALGAANAGIVALRMRRGPVSQPEP